MGTEAESIDTTAAVPVGAADGVEVEPDDALDVPAVAIKPERRRGISGWLTAKRKPVVVAHRWLGIVLALWIVLEGVTGSILVFEPELDRWFSGDDYSVTSGHQVGLTRAVDAAREARPDEPVRYVIPPGENGPVYQVGTVDRDGDAHVVMVDPGSGRVNTADHEAPWWLSMSERLHLNLNATEILGVKATTILGWLGVLWLVIVVTGFYVWYWPRIRKWVHLARVRRRRGRFTFNLDLHNAVGMVFLIPMFLVVLTGVNFMFPNQVRDVYEVVTFGAYHEPDQTIATSTGTTGTPITAADAERVVASLDPAVEPYYVLTPSGSPVATYTVYANVDPSFLGMLGGQHQVEFSVDQYTGAIVKVEDVLDDNAATQAYASWAYPVHAGTFGGDITRVLWFVLGLTPIVLGWTGYVMWLTRRRRRARAAARATAAASPEVEEPELEQV
jgi:uncharacterized iron-regulated membrane protein